MLTSRDPFKPKSPVEKLQAAIAKVKADTGRDPRAGGWSIVGREPYVRTVMAELPLIFVEQVGPIALGDRDAAELIDGGRGNLCGADLAFLFQGVPVIVRASAADGLWLLPNDKIPRSNRPDRAAAGVLRMTYRAGNIEAAPAIPGLNATREPGKVHIEGVEGVDSVDLSN